MIINKYFSTTRTGRAVRGDGWWERGWRMWNINTNLITQLIIPGPSLGAGLRAEDNEESQL